MKQREIEDKCCICFMNSRVLFLLLSFIASVCLLPCSCFAADHGQAPGVDTLLFPAINFSLYILALCFIYHKYIKRVLVERTATIKAHLLRAVSVLSEARAAFDGSQTRASRLDDEKALLVRSLDKETEDIEAQILENARLTVVRIQDDAVRQVERMFIRVNKEVRDEMLREVFARVRSILQDGVPEDVDKQIRDRALQALSAAAINESARMQ